MSKLRGGFLGKAFVLLDAVFAALSIIIPPTLNEGADIKPAGRPRTPDVREPAETRSTRREGVEQDPPDAKRSGGGTGAGPDDPPSRTRTTGSGANVTDNTPNRTGPAGGTPSC